MTGTLDKFQRTFFVMSACEKIWRLVDRCNACLAKEMSIQAKREPHVPSTVDNQIYSDRTEFVNKLWIELFSELKILHTRTPPFNPSSNILEQWHRTIVSILPTMHK